LLLSEAYIGCTKDMSEESSPELLGLALEAEQHSQALSRAEARVLSLTAENLHFRDRLRALTEQLSLNAQTASAARDSLVAASSDSAERTTALVHENDTLRCLVRSLQGRVEGYSTRLQDLERGVVGRDGLLEASEGRNAALSAEHAELRLLAADLHEELASEKACVASLRADRSAGARREEELQRRLEAALSAAAMASEGASSALVEANASRASAAGLGAMLEELQGRLAAAEGASAASLASSQAALAASAAQTEDLQLRLQHNAVLGGGNSSTSGERASLAHEALVRLQGLGGSAAANPAYSVATLEGERGGLSLALKLEALRSELSACAEALRISQHECAAARSRAEESEAVCAQARFETAEREHSLRAARECAEGSAREVLRLSSLLGHKEASVVEAEARGAHAASRLTRVLEEKDGISAALLAAQARMQQLEGDKEAALSRLRDAEARWSRESASLREARAALAAAALPRAAALQRSPFSDGNLLPPPSAPATPQGGAAAAAYSRRAAAAHPLNDTLRSLAEDTGSAASASFAAAATAAQGLRGDLARLQATLAQTNASLDLK
jgi:chromosome segregation ATPase